MATLAAGRTTATHWRTYHNLRWFNGGMAVLHLAQGLAILLLSEAVTFPVTTSYLVMDEETQKLEPLTRTIFELRLGVLVACFLFISAIAHTLVTLPRVYEWYVANLRRNINYVRWWEYAASASLMIVVIAVLAGMYDLSSMILIFSLNAMMLLCGLLMEVFNRPGERVNWTPYYFGCFAGGVPWLVIALYLFSPGTGGDPPTFVYAIFVSLLIWYSLFAVNMWLQYRRIGPWRDYLVGETGYIILSLTAKSALAWQTFAGALTTPAA